ncbi:MAG TPA: MFS transporter [Actinomycetales bacterium]|nr:MFS transporter [Actinomycetales bacterium]
MSQTTTGSGAPAQSAASLPRRPLLLLAFAAFWTVTLELLPAGLLPAMSEDLAVRPSRVGLLVTAWAVTVALTSIPLTRATRRLGGPATLGLALGALGVSTMLTALAPGYGAVVLSRLVAAAGHGLFWSVVMVYAASIAPQGRQARAIAVVNTGPLLASAVGLPLGTALGDLFGWRLVMGVIAIAMVVGGVALRASLPDSTHRAETAPTGRRDPTAVPVVLTALLGALALLAHFAVFTFVGPLAAGQWGLGEGSVTGLLLVFGTTGAFGLGMAGLFGDRRPRGMLAGAILALAVLFVLLAVPWKWPLMTFVGVAGWGVLLGVLPPLLQNVVIGAASPGYRRAAGSVLVATFNLGIAAGAMAGGLVLDHLGLSRLLPVAAAAALASAAGLSAMRRRHGSPDS